MSPNEIGDISFDVILIASSYRWQILEQLQRRHGVPIDKIIVVPPGIVVA